MAVFADPYDTYKKRLEKRLTREAEERANAGLKKLKKDERDKDRTTCVFLSFLSLPRRRAKLTPPSPWLEQMVRHGFGKGEGGRRHRGAGGQSGWGGQVSGYDAGVGGWRGSGSGQEEVGGGFEWGDDGWWRRGEEEEEGWVWGFLGVVGGQCLSSCDTSLSPRAGLDETGIWCRRRTQLLGVPEVEVSRLSFGLPCSLVARFLPTACSSPTRPAANPPFTTSDRSSLPRSASSSLRLLRCPSA